MGQSAERRHQAMIRRWGRFADHLRVRSVSGKGRSEAFAKAARLMVSKTITSDQSLEAIIPFNESKM
jgi:hypothetical protein